MAGTPSSDTTTEPTVDTTQAPRKVSRPVVRWLAASGVVVGSVLAAGPAWAGPIMGC